MRIPFKQVSKVLLNQAVEKESWRQIILTFRFPKALTAAFAGAALAMAGLQMQTMFHNPLADPFILGINSGASLGWRWRFWALVPRGLLFGGTLHVRGFGFSSSSLHGGGISVGSGAFGRALGA